jgi:DNA-binding MltR family transcriptional regulator
MPGLMLDPSAKDAMFGGSGSLATFSSKIAMAFALGIIDRQMRNDIDVIREMRKAYAHSRMPISFEQADLQAACKRILSQELPSMTTHEPKALREVFVIKTVMMQETVLTGKRRVFKDEVARLAHARALAEALKTSPNTSQQKPPRRSNPGDPPQD